MPMSSSAWLLCEVLERDPERARVKSQIVDGEEIDFVAPANVIKDRDAAEGVWVRCESRGQSGNVVGLVLPGPVLRLGRQINVDISQVSFHPDPA